MPNEPVEHLSDNSLEARLEPFDGLLTLDLVRSTDVGLASATLGNTLARSGPTNSQHNSNHSRRCCGYSHAAVKIHSVDTNRRVVLDTKINVFADTETEVASLGEVALAELIFLDLQSTLQDFLSLWSSDGNVDSDLLVTTDTECSDGVSGFACEDSCQRLPLIAESRLIVL
jgi:hypothetical protein